MSKLTSLGAEAVDLNVSLSGPLWDRRRLQGLRRSCPTQVGRAVAGLLNLPSHVSITLV